jgi:hypothetical protein
MDDDNKETNDRQKYRRAFCEFNRGVSSFHGTFLRYSSLIAWTAYEHGDPAAVPRQESKPASLGRRCSQHIDLKPYFSNLRVAAQNVAAK